MEEGDLARAVERYLGNSRTAPIARTAFRRARDAADAAPSTCADADRAPISGAPIALWPRGSSSRSAAARRARNSSTLVSTPRPRRRARRDRGAALGARGREGRQAAAQARRQGQGHPEGLRAAAPTHPRRQAHEKDSQGHRRTRTLWARHQAASLARGPGRDSIEDLEKLLSKTKDDDVRQAVLRGLSFIYDGENAWVEDSRRFAGQAAIAGRDGGGNRLAAAAASRRPTRPASTPRDARSSPPRLVLAPGEAACAASSDWPASIGGTLKHGHHAGGPARRCRRRALRRRGARSSRNAPTERRCGGAPRRPARPPRCPSEPTAPAPGPAPTPISACCWPRHAAARARASGVAGLHRRRWGRRLAAAGGNSAAFGRLLGQQVLFSTKPAARPGM